MPSFTKTVYLFLLCFFSSILLSAQGNNCGDIEPVLQCLTDITLCEMEISDPPTLTTPSNLPNLEYAIVDYSIPSSSGTGPSVVGIDADGIFEPSEYNINPGINFGVIPIAYDLAAIQETLDDVLKGTIIFTFSCCDLAASTGGIDVCGSLNTAGIFCGADVTSLSQAATLFSTSGNSSDFLSITDFVQQIDNLNVTLSDPGVPSQCGGGDKIAYAYGAECTYQVLADTLYLSATHTNNELLEATDLVSSSSMVDAPNIVVYNSSICIELTAGFETVIGAEFTAEIKNPCM